jgi:chromosome segregation protein
LKLQLEKQKITTKEAQDSQDSAYQELIAVKAQKEALEAISKPKVAHNETLQAHLDTRALIDSFDVEPGFEALVELVINRHKGAMIVADATASDIDASFYATKAGEVVYFQSEMTATKKANSLASKLKNPFVPQVFNTITVVESDEIALAKLESMLRDRQHQKNTTDSTIDWSIISKTGLWLFPDHLINGAGEEVDNYLSRQAEIERLSERCGALSTHFEQLKHQTDKHKEQEAKLYELLIGQEQTYKDFDEQAFRLSTQLAQLQQQITEQTFRKERVQQELDKYRLNAEEELETLALLNEEVETTALELAEYEEVMQNTQVQSEELHRALQSTRSRVEQLIAQSHETAMQVQQIKSRYSLLNEKQIGREAQQSEIREKIVLLEEEAEELSMPMEDQQEKLQALLDEKEQSIQQQTALQVELAEIEEMLIQAEKGQSGVNQAAERIKSEIESLRLQAEGAKVRAQSYLEQLDEMQQPLKPILEDLPDDIDEKEWQETLDKTAASLARLGAVNLAAVEEYETQAERKGHLDAQNDDLSQALDTLEAAIKKIEKETRNRFKATFDRINNDLKMLFPKVFGGGSAHLALTDDDMLDTGVTIMARPPGKKNSTIHLLSGGEKALTALSLVFAIFRLNPAPFCLLDEVDAPLDDANVGRFCKLVSEMSKTVQFIYITHNKVAMEMASHLTGVTMAEPGVSRMVAVDVEEAMAIAE